MLIHITPRILISQRNGGPECKLIDLTIDELDLRLLGGKDLTVRRPYPNKRYQVACRNEGLRSVVGLLIETPDHLNTFTSKAQWLVGDRRIVTHTVTYVVLDNDFDAVSDHMMLWRSPPQGSPEVWPCRWPKTMTESIADLQPRMDLKAGSRSAIADDSLADDGFIKARRETFFMPTLERGRLFSSRARDDRLPKEDQAFAAPERMLASAA